MSSQPSFVRWQARLQPATPPPMIATLASSTTRRDHPATGLPSLHTSVAVAVLVVAADPDLPVVVALGSTLRGVVEDRVVAHDELKPAPGRGVGVEDVV